jgi:hypothetical protein
MRRAYKEPKLTRFGAFRDLTLEGKKGAANDLAQGRETCNPGGGGAAQCPPS